MRQPKFDTSWFAFLACLFFAAAAYGDDALRGPGPSAGAGRLKELRAKIGGAEKKLGDLRLDKEKIAGGVEKIKSDLAALEARKREGATELKRIDRELQALELSQSENERRSADESGALEERLVEMYKLERHREGVSFLLSAVSSQDLLKRTHMLAILASQGDTTINRLAELKGRMTAEQEQYESVKQERAAGMEAMQRLSSELEKKRKESADLLLQAGDREQQQKSLLSQLRGEAKVLEEALASVMGEQETPSPDRGPNQETAVQEKGFDGPGLLALKGKLAFPVKGKVLQGFGPSHHEEFADLLVVKGLEVSSSVGAPVKPVAPGKVVLAQVIPGFGNVVIVDHGERYYSLYGRLASSLVQAGELVQGRDTIGMTGEPDYRGRNFYFELRFKGKAVDPKDFFPSLPS